MLLLLMVGCGIGVINLEVLTTLIAIAAIITTRLLVRTFALLWRLRGVARQARFHVQSTTAVRLRGEVAIIIVGLLRLMHKHIYSRLIFRGPRLYRVRCGVLGRRWWEGKQVLTATALAILNLTNQFAVLGILRTGEWAAPRTAG